MHVMAGGVCIMVDPACTYEKQNYGSKESRTYGIDVTQSGVYSRFLTFATKDDRDWVLNEIAHELCAKRRPHQ